MICSHCRTRIRYRFAWCWWSCACRIWATDEQLTRELN